MFGIEYVSTSGDRAVFGTTYDTATEAQTFADTITTFASVSHAYVVSN